MATFFPHQRMQAVLDASDLDAIVAISPENVFYLSNALILTQRYIPDRLAVVVWSKAQGPTMIVCTTEESLTRQDSAISDIRTYVEFVPLIGHSLGVVLHEHPTINRVTAEIVQPGMLFCIEPASLAPDGNQYHIEDLVLATDAGPQIVSRAADWSRIPEIGKD